MRVVLKSLGCRVNEAELERWSRDFRARGHQIVDPPAAADLVVLNSCAVTADAVRKSRYLLRRLQQEHPGAKLVLSGCYASLNRAEAESLGVDLLVTNADKDRLAEIVETELNDHGMPAAAADPEIGSPLPANRQRAFVKVQDGCRYRCTYCIVTLARGDERSRPADEVVREIDRLAQQGVPEVVLTGIHLGGYGSDSGTSLEMLIRNILDRTGICRLRLGSLEPWDLPASFFDLFIDRRMMPHLHLPLQSGSDEILRSMARRCKTGEFARLADQARARIPDINITTDIIVGFPGETERHWAESLAFIDAMAFGHIHIFPYSPRAGTKAANLPDPVPDPVKKSRSAELHSLAKSAKETFQSRFLGRSFPVLVEGIEQNGHGPDRARFGYTPNYMRIGIEQRAGAVRHDRIVSVRIDRFDASTNHLVGMPSEP